MSLPMNIGSRFRSVRDPRRIVEIVADVHPSALARWGCNKTSRVVIQNKKTGRKYKVSTAHLSAEYVRL